ncbi:MAG: hypothetical protein RJA63_2706 [Pseudomonadota bacterium]|jgi:hypothetical protein
MQFLNEAVPYVERCIRTSSGTNIVWPFLNAEKGPGPYELFLDTNALSNVQWFAQLPDEIRAKCVINPWPALLEQWLSNPLFRDSTIDRIDAMIEGLAKLGAPFRDQFAQQQESLLRKNDAALRTQFSLIVPYVAIMKSLLAQKLPAEEALQRLEAMTQRDIPRFTSAMMLVALGTLLKSKQSLKLAGDSKPAFSYLDSFLAFQPGQKDETDHINVPYLRNRAGDLNLWLSLPLLRQQGYRFVGTPAVVTGDRALHRLILRVIPPVLHDGLTMGFWLFSEGLPASLCERIVTIATSIQVRACTKAEDQLARMSALFELANECCTEDRERLALDQVFSDWWRPGFGKQIDLS